MLLQIFTTFIKIGASNFGGGYAMTALIKAEAVDRLHWLTVPQFADILATIQLAPGAVALTSSTFLGYVVGGIPGALLAGLALALPSLIVILTIMTVLKRFQGTAVQAVFGGIRPAGLAFLFTSGIILGQSALIDIKTVVIAGISFWAIYRGHLHPLLVFVGVAIVGLLLL